MLDWNVLLRQECDEVPKGTLSCPDRNLAVFHHYRHYEGLRLLPSVCDSKLIQQTLTKSPTTTEAKDGKIPKNPFVMDEIVISVPKSKNVNPNNDNNETDNK